MSSPTSDDTPVLPTGFIVEATLEVAVGQTLFACFDANGVQGIRTQHVNDSTAVIIISPYAVGMSHFSPCPGINREDPISVAEDTEATMRRFRDVHRSHASYFPPEQQRAYVIYAMYNGRALMPTQVDIIERHLWEMGVVSVLVCYTAMLGKESCTQSLKNIFVDWRNPTPKMRFGTRYAGPLTYCTNSD